MKRKPFTEIPLHKQLHFIGIGGAGMSALAKVAVEKGYKVSGSDLKEGISTIRLKDMGVTVFLGHEAQHMRQADICIVSSAVPADNPELEYAKRENIPIMKRAEFLAMLMAQGTKRIAIAGTHGKTTTSSMLTRVIDAAGLSPTFIVGAELKDYGGNSALGKGPYFIAEADESDGSFLYLNPNIALLTNIEDDHLDYYKNFDNIKSHFAEFMAKVAALRGLLVLNADDPVLRDLGAAHPKYTWYYGIDTPAKVMASHIQASPKGVSFTVTLDGTELGSVQLQVHGKHNVSNALSVIAFGLAERFSFEDIKKGLNAFSGTKRRFQHIGSAAGIEVYDDYGHHPTEIKATLSAIKAGFKNRLVCIFQPHRYTRTRDLMDSFTTAFDDADMVVITEIYAANEPKIEHISGKTIVDKMTHPHTLFISKKSTICETLVPQLKKGDLVITMGAGDIYSIGKELLAQLNTQKGA